MARLSWVVLSSGGFRSVSAASHQPWAWAAVCGQAFFRMSCLISPTISCGVQRPHVPQEWASPASLCGLYPWETSESGWVECWFSTLTPAHLLCDSERPLTYISRRECPTIWLQNELTARGVRGSLSVVSGGVLSQFLLGLAIKITAFHLRKSFSSSSLISMALHFSLAGMFLFCFMTKYSYHFGSCFFFLSLK